MLISRITHSKVNEFQNKGYALLFTRLPNRVWWRDTLIIWLLPFFFLVVYRPLLMPEEANQVLGPKNLDTWMVGAVVVGIVLSLGLSWLSRHRKGPQRTR